jgi:hypothetical protein
MRKFLASLRPLSLSVFFLTVEFAVAVAFNYVYLLTFSLLFSLSIILAVRRGLWLYPFGSTPALSLATAFALNLLCSFTLAKAVSAASASAVVEAAALKRRDESDEDVMDEGSEGELDSMI